MLLRRIAGSHSNDVVVSFGKDNVLVGVIMLRVAECRGDDVGESPTVHELNESLGYLVEVAGEYQPFFEGGLGGSKDDRMLVHGNQSILDSSLWYRPVVKGESGNVKKRDLAPDPS